jgi:ABC-2 type transport system permease protein
MRAEVLRRALLDRRRGFAGWGGGIVGLVLLTVLLYPSIEGNQELNQLLDDYPDAARALLGVGELDLVSPAGYLNSQLFAVMVPVVIAIFAIGAGAAAVAGDEEHGTIELLLAQPLSRQRLVAERALAMAAGVVLLCALTFLATWGAALIVGMEIGAGAIAAACLGLALLGLTGGAVALAGGCATGRRSAGIAAGAAVMTGGYLLDSLGQVIDGLEPWRPLSPFRWYDAAGLLTDGLRPGLLVLLAAAAAFGVAGAVLFARRDLRL